MELYQEVMKSSNYHGVLVQQAIDEVTSYAWRYHRRGQELGRQRERKSARYHGGAGA